MWLDYGLWVSTLLVLVALIALIVIMIRNRAGRRLQLLFVAGHSLFPGGDWTRGPVEFCEAVGMGGVISLPESVRSGEWMLCDYATCHQLVPG